MTTAYVDASALVKLVVEEPASEALRRFLVEFDEHVSSRVGIVETFRASARGSIENEAVSRRLMPIGTIELDRAIAATAAGLQPARLRTLDAIHLASALVLYHVDAFVTYDTRLAEAARDIGLAVASPL